MRLMVKVVLYVCIIMVIFAIPAIAYLLQNQQQAINELAHIKAKTVYEMIVITRQWVADNRDSVTPVPAVVTKELSKYADVTASFKFGITSDKLVNPDNAPDKFEKRALEKLSKDNLTEYHDVFIDENGKRLYRYAAPLHINESCLSCHSASDYRINDLRGIISISFPLNIFEQSIVENNKTISYIVFIGFFLIIIMISILIYLMVIRQLITLQEAAEAMRKGNRIETNLQTDDEIQTLSEVFDQMSAQIANNEEILKYNLHQAVSKYIGLLQELEIKNKKLDSLNKLKSDLLDSIAHEIRTPLTKIFSYSELLQDSRINSQQHMRDKFANSLKNNINLIKNMFNDIITLSRLEHEQHLYHKIPIQIDKLINDLIENMDMEIADKNITIELDIENFTLYVDGETFSVAISNIIGNAIKYSKYGGTINITTKTVDNHHLIIVKDYGIGIPESDLDKIFERFARAGNTKKFKGTGLGLSIVAKIIEDHNSTIKIDSVENEWTSVTVSLPIADINKIEEQVIDLHK